MKHSLRGPPRPRGSGARIDTDEPGEPMTSTKLHRSLAYVLPAPPLAPFAARRHRRRLAAAEPLGELYRRVRAARS